MDAINAIVADHPVVRMAAAPEPAFRYNKNKSIILAPTPDADVCARNKADKSKFTAQTPEMVASDARARISHQGGSVTTQTVRANSTIQFGQYHGQTFKWLLLNAMGYAVQFAVSYEVQTVQASAMQNTRPLGINKVSA